MVELGKVPRWTDDSKVEAFVEGILLEHEKLGELEHALQLEHFDEFELRSPSLNRERDVLAAAKHGDTKPVVDLALHLLREHLRSKHLNLGTELELRLRDVVRPKRLRGRPKMTPEQRDEEYYVHGAAVEARKIEQILRAAYPWQKTMQLKDKAAWIATERANRRIEKLRAELIQDEAIYEVESMPKKLGHGAVRGHLERGKSARHRLPER